MTTPATPPAGDPAAVPPAEPGAGAPPAPPAPAAATPPPGDEPLGEPGKRALEAERAARKVAEQQAKDLQAQIDEIRKAQMTDAEKAVAEAEARGRTAAEAEWLERHAKDQIALAAAGKLADPMDATAFIPISDVLAADGKRVDHDRLNTALDGLLKAKPHLAGARPVGFGPADLGGQPGPTQLTREQLKTMTPEQITEAHEKGLLKHLLSGAA